MEPHEDYSVLRVVSEHTLENEVNDRLSSPQSVGNTAIGYLRRSMAISGITTLLVALGPVTAQTDATDNYAPVESALVAKPHHPDHAEQHEPSHSSTHSRTARFKCAWITNYPKGYYEGEACSDDKLIKMWSSPSRKFDYGMFIVNGVDKCGWVEKGVVPTRQAKGDPEGCQKAYKPLLNPSTILTKIECDPGACNDGTLHTPLSPDCDHKFFQNFATRSKSPLNLDPQHDKNGFSGYVGEQFGFVHYRGTIKTGSNTGDAIVVRSDTLGWGVMNAECAQPDATTTTQAGATPVQP